MYNTVGQRLREYLDKTDRLQKEVTNITGIRKENVSDWLTGKKSIPTKHIQTILRYYKDLSARWLLTGEGDMFYNPEYTKSKNKELISVIDERFKAVLLKEEKHKEDEIEALKIALKAQQELIDNYRENRIQK